MILRKLFRNRGLGLNLIAGACFILLLVNGWGLSWRDLGGYLLALLVLLGGLIIMAALCGWLLRKFMGRNQTSVDQFNNAKQEDDGESIDPESNEQK